MSATEIQSTKKNSTWNPASWNHKKVRIFICVKIILFCLQIECQLTNIRGVRSLKEVFERHMVSEPDCDLYCVFFTCDWAEGIFKLWFGSVWKKTAGSVLLHENLSYLAESLCLLINLILHFKLYASFSCYLTFCYYLFPVLQHLSLVIILLCMLYAGKRSYVLWTKDSTELIRNQFRLCIQAEGAACTGSLPSMCLFE